MKCLLMNQCPLLNLGICFKYPEYIDLSSKRGYGCLFAHVLKVIEIWDSIKKCYLSQLRRIISRCLYGNITNRNEIDDLVKVMLILHDYGKAAEEYYRPDERFRYFHETLSAAIVFKVLENYDELVASIIASTVLLHHEHRIYEILYRTGYTSFNDVVIRELLGNILKINVNQEANQSFKKILQKNIDSIDLNMNSFLTCYSQSILKEVLDRIIRKILARPILSWTCVGALNHVLIISDIRAAYALRKSIKNKISRYFNTILHGGRFCP